MIIEREDVVRFASLNDGRAQEYLSGREVSGQELIKHSAGETLVNLARVHAARKKCSFSEALAAVSRICPGELKSYLGLKRMAITDETRLLPRGVRKVTEMEFMANVGWTFNGVEAWLVEQGFEGGILMSIAGGWRYSPDPGQNAFPR